MLSNIVPMTNNDQPFEQQVRESIEEWDEETQRLARDWGVTEEEVADILEEINNHSPYDGHDVPDEWPNFRAWWPDYGGTKEKHVEIAQDEEQHINDFVENATQHYNDEPLHKPAISLEVVSSMEAAMKNKLRKEKQE